MSCNSKKIRPVAKVLKCRSRPNLSEGTCQTFCKSYQNWESYG